MSIVKLLNLLQIRIIELIYQIDAKKESDKFMSIMVNDLRNGAHAANRVKFNKYEEELIRMADNMDNINNYELDCIIKKFKIIKDKYLIHIPDEI